MGKSILFFVGKYFNHRLLFLNTCWLVRCIMYRQCAVNNLLKDCGENLNEESGYKNSLGKNNERGSVPADTCIIM